MSGDAASADDLSKLDEISEVLDDENFVSVDPGVNHAQLLSQIEELKQDLAVAENIIAKSNITENELSRHNAQTHLSVTQLVDENSLLETQVRTLRDKLQAAQMGTMSELKAMFEAEKQELISKYTFEVEDLQMNCKLQAQTAQENGNRYNAEASNTEKLNAALEELRRKSAAQAEKIHDLEAKVKRDELRIATDAEDVESVRSLAKNFGEKIDELHSRIEAMYAAAEDGDANQTKLMAKELSQAKVELEKVALEKKQAATDRAKAEATEKTLNELCESEKKAKEEYKAQLEKVVAELEKSRAEHKAVLDEERTKFAQSTDQWRGKIHDIKVRRDKLDILNNEAREKLARTESALRASNAAHSAQGELWSKREVVLRAAVTRLQKFVKSLQGQVERYREKLEVHNNRNGKIGGGSDGQAGDGPMSGATAAAVSDLQSEILHLKISNRKSEEQLRLLRKELASAKTANVLALASARRLSEQAENALAMAAALEIEEARRSGSSDVMARVNRSMKQLFHHQRVNHALSKADLSSQESKGPGGDLVGLVPGQRVRIVALVDEQTDSPSVYNNSLATIKAQLTSNRDITTNRFVVVVDGSKGEDVEVSARNLVWGKELGDMGSLPSRSSARRNADEAAPLPGPEKGYELTTAQRQILEALHKHHSDSPFATPQKGTPGKKQTPNKNKSPSKTNYSELKRKLVLDFGDWHFNQHKDLVQLELKRLSSGAPSLLEDPTHLAKLDNKKDKKPKGGWWSQLTNNVKKAFVKDDKPTNHIDFDVELLPDMEWGFSLVKVDPESPDSLAAVQLQGSDFDEDIHIEGHAPPSLATSLKLQDGDVVVGVGGQKCTGWPDAAIKAGLRRIKNKEVDDKGVTLTLRRYTDRRASKASPAKTNSAHASPGGSQVTSRVSSRKPSGEGDTPQKRNDEALALATAAAEAAAAAGSGTQWKLVPIDSSSPPLAEDGSVCGQDDPKVKAVYEAWTKQPARHGALRAWFGNVLSGAAFADSESTAKVELKSLSTDAITGFLNVLLPLLLHDAPMLELEVYLRRAATSTPDADPLLGGPVQMDMRIFVSPKFM